MMAAASTDCATEVPAWREMAEGTFILVRLHCSLFHHWLRGVELCEDGSRGLEELCEVSVCFLELPPRRQ
ncbi:unnamed protein product [Lampetra planeri]